MLKLGDWLADSPFALAMSSGFFSFYAHTGMLDAVTSAGLRPQLVAGSSAGAMVGAAYAADFPMAEMAKRLNTLERRDFWDPAPGPGLLAGKKFDRLLREMAPTVLAEECRVPIKISVFDILRRKTRRDLPRRLADGDARIVCGAGDVSPGVDRSPRLLGRRNLGSSGPRRASPTASACCSTTSQPPHRGVAAWDRRSRNARTW